MAAHSCLLRGKLRPGYCRNEPLRCASGQPHHRRHEPRVEGRTAGQRKDGVLILSELAVSFEQLSEQCIPIAPTDLEGTVRALHQALNMPAEERKRRAAALKSLIQDEDITYWLERQFADLMAISRQQL